MRSGQHGTNAVNDVRNCVYSMENFDISPVMYIGMIGTVRIQFPLIQHGQMDDVRSWEVFWEIFVYERR